MASPVSVAQPVSVAMRTIQPQDPARPSLAALSDDLILNILDMVNDASPKSIPNCLLVCSSFYHHGRYVLHRELSIKIDSHDSMTHLELASRENLLPAVRKLAVYGSGDLPSSLDDMIRRMTGLREIEWSAATVTKSILQTLQSFPRIALSVLITNDTKKLLVDVPGSTSLVSVSVDTTWTTAEECKQVTQPLKQVLLSCPNVRKLSLNITRPTRGCVVTQPPLEYVGIGFAPGEKPPPLQELCVHSYPWGFKSDHPNSLNVNYLGYPGEGREMDYWINEFDWSHLTHLEDASNRFAHKLVRNLTNLKHIGLIWSQGLADKEFFASVPSALESICIATLDSIGIDGLVQHAESLRKLQFHQKPRQMDQWREGIISDDNLILIREKLPQLQELGIDVKRNKNEWPDKTFDILAGFPNLQKLELRFELGGARDIRLKPHLTMAAVSELFGYLVKRSSTLRVLRVHSGSPDLPQISGWETGESFWPVENSTSFKCQHAERDDNAARGNFQVTCTKLSDELNNKAQLIIRGQEELEDVSKNGVDFRVALKGPVPLEEWLDLRKEKA
ncbi:hypothetical protein ACHAO9_010858 [Fusarium lateritium]